MNVRKLLTAEQIMQRDVFTLSPDDDVVHAVQTLLKKGVSGAPVVQNGRVVGMFSERDSLAVLAAAAYEQEPRGKVAHHMRAEIRCVEPGTDLFELTRVFLETLVRRIPVVGPEKQLLGLVLRSDVMHGLQEAWCTESAQPRPEPRTPYEKIADRLADSGR
ncbi:MAG: hypothetical protein Fur0037_19950 [Planctomycetota bacterium]